MLTTVGKVYKTIKRNGFFNGGKVVFMYLGIFLKNILRGKNGDILIITGGVGDSAFYRAQNQAEELNLHGLKCAPTIAGDLFLLRYAGKFKIFIFHRTRFSHKIAKFVEKIKKQNKEIIFDTDDLVYDAKLFHETDAYASMNAFEKKQYEKGVGEEIINNPCVKVCTVSTSYLAGKLLEKGKQVFISKNKLSNHELEIADNILKSKEKIKDNKVKIGYFSGTISHNKDFETISEAIAKVMEKYPQAELWLAGYLDTNDKINKFRNRIKKLPFVPREKYWENIWKVDINLAPLVKDDPFCEAKSELKFFEPGILKIPTVAVRNRTFSEAINDGVNGFLADNDSEWVEKIGKLVEDENLRHEMGEKARERVLCDYTNKNSHNEEYYNYLKSKI
jgi:O-antigen biosynthesis protein